MSKLIRCLAVIHVVALLLAGRAQGAPFVSGSTGADGVLNVTGTMQLPKRSSGIYNYTTVNIGAAGILTFERNDANTPIYLLASSNVTIQGRIDVSGSAGTAFNGGEAGPGGYDGGKPGIAGAAPGAGYGPGAGKGGENAQAVNGAGGGSYATVGSSGISSGNGPTYGSELLVPMVGGSGGGGMPGLGGGGGGGAIVIASSTRIDLGGSILAHGGTSGFGYGSGGAIRLLAPVVAGGGSLSVFGFGWGGDGRIRIDTLNRDQLDLNYNPGIPRTLAIGAFMAVFPPVNPQLLVISVAGQQIPPGTKLPLTVTLSVGTPANQTVELEARDFNQVLSVTLALTPDTGPPSFYNVNLDNLANNPVKRSVAVNLPPNTVIRVMAWTR